MKLCNIYIRMRVKLAKEGRERMKNLSNTQFFKVEPAPKIEPKDILEIVYNALKERV